MTERRLRLGSRVRSLSACDQEDKSDEGEGDDLDVDIGEVGGLLSWTVGVAFGRFDVRLATGERPLLHGPEPFDPLPPKSPGHVAGWRPSNPSKYWRHGRRYRARA